jgi:hypothetical protein
LRSQQFRQGLHRSFLPGEGDCTSEKGAGQFSIFGAVEEKGGGESWGEFGDGARAGEGL